MYDRKLTTLLSATALPALLRCQSERARPGIRRQVAAFEVTDCRYVTYCSVTRSAQTAVEALNRDSDG